MQNMLLLTSVRLIEISAIKGNWMRVSLENKGRSLRSREARGLLYDVYPSRNPGPAINPNEL